MNRQRMSCLNNAIARVYRLMEKQGSIVTPHRWQGMSLDINNKTQSMVELTFVDIRSPIPSTPELLGLRCANNLPWAENHFQERICGHPINPGVEYMNWPWGAHSESSMSGGKFNHNYMERYWSKFAGKDDSPSKTVSDLIFWLEDKPLSGIRGEYGDLDDVIHTLAHEPDTRQAYLPVWFPEDTSAKNTGRKPCSLGYHFYLSDGRLHLRYDIRSCDLYRHFRDDIYLTCRLGQHVLERCKKLNPHDWGNVEMGDLVMTITSLHMFYNDYLVTYKHTPEKQI